jgi:hypothetical protein
MKKWAFISPGILKSGITEDGFPFIENNIIGRQNDHPNSDYEELVNLHAVIYDDGSEVILKIIYSSEEAMANPEIRMQADMVEKQLLNDVQLWINGNV